MPFWISQYSLMLRSRAQHGVSKHGTNGVRVATLRDAPLRGAPQGEDLLLVIPLLEPRVAVVVVAAHFPEAGLVVHRELDALDPLGALPEIELGDHHAQRAAMLAADRLAVPA